MTGPSAGALTVVRPGLATTVQDLGRPGHAHLGVPRGGAVDRAALVRANRLVGNPDDAAGLEVLLRGPALTSATGWTVAVAGAGCRLTVDGNPAPEGWAVTVPAGATLSLDRVRDGLRCYLAVRGGLDLPLVLGSRSADLLSGLGPPPLVEGMLLPVGPVPGACPVAAAARPDGGPPRAEDGALLLDVVPGPHGSADARADAHLQTALGGPWEVDPRSDRTALRLTGPALPALDRVGSSGLLPGALQVPPDGRPLLFLAGAPATGGYPVVGVLTTPAVDRAAQLRPGDRLRLRLVPPPWPGLSDPARRLPA